MASPFSDVYDALWTMVESHTGLAAIVRIGNRIKFNDDTNRGPTKNNTSSADYPELRLVPAGTEANLPSSSSGSTIVRSWNWEIYTGDMRLAYDSGLDDIDWFLIQVHNCPNDLFELSFDGEEGYVKRVTFTDNNIGFDLLDPDRNINGWQAVWTVSVEMAFSKSALTPPTATTTTT